MGWFYDGQYKEDRTMTVRRYWEKVYLPDIIKGCKKSGIVVAAKNFHGDNSWGESYIALKKEGKEKADYCLVTLFNKNEYGIGYKEMDNSMGPAYFHASQKVLDALEPAKSEFDREWREECKKQLVRSQKQDERKRLESVFGLDK